MAEAAPNPVEVSRLQGKKAIRSYARKLTEPELIKDLNITPMMDMMTIILVFLLKSFSSSSSTLAFDDNLKIPRAESTCKALSTAGTWGPSTPCPKEAKMLTITKKMLLVEGDMVAPINGGKVDPAVKRDGENGYYITPMVELLEKHARQEKKVAQLMGATFEAELMVVADGTTPYRLLTEVLYSAGQAGYANYRLLVLRAKD